MLICINSCFLAFCFANSMLGCVAGILCFTSSAHEGTWQSNMWDTWSFISYHNLSIFGKSPKCNTDADTDTYACVGHFVIPWVWLSPRNTNGIGDSCRINACYHCCIMWLVSVWSLSFSGNYHSSCTSNFARERLHIEMARCIKCQHMSTVYNILNHYIDADLQLYATLF